METKDICVGYGQGYIIDKMNIQIPSHKITSIIGANGCGKSTLLKALSRILPCDEGQVILDGKALTESSTKEIAKKIAILPQRPSAASGLLARELVAYGRYPYQKGFKKMSDHDYHMIEWALEVTGTLDFGDKEVDALSGGQLQRVWIAMALAQETKIIFLDEPTTFLDLAHQLEVLELLNHLNKDQERTIIMVLHDINHAARFSDHIIAMKQGSIVKTGDVNDIMNPKILKEVYNIEAYIDKDPLTGRPMCLSYNIA